MSDNQEINFYSEESKQMAAALRVPKAVSEIDNNAMDVLKNLMIDTIKTVSDSEAIFKIEDLTRAFSKNLEKYTQDVKSYKYIKSENFLKENDLNSNNISVAELRKTEDAKKEVEKRKIILKSFLISKNKPEVLQYIIEAYGGILSVGDFNESNPRENYYTTAETLEYEKDIIENATENDEKFKLNNHEAMEKAIDNKRPLISNEQIDAIYECTSVARRISIVEGIAGAGKSFTMEGVNESYIAEGYYVMGTALSWTAASVLKASAKIPDCRAIEGLVMDLEKAANQRREFFSGDTLLIVDEAGLVGIKNMSKIIKYTGMSQYKVKIVLTGDTKQLDPVKAGSALSLVKAVVGSKVIKKIRRQHLPSHRNMVYALMEMRAGHGLNYLYQQGAIHFCKNNEATLNRMVVDLINFKYNNPDKTTLLLAKTNYDVKVLNDKVRAMYKKMGWIYGKETQEMTVTDGSKTWKTSFAIGDCVSLCVNDKTIPVYDIPHGEEKKSIHEKTLNVTEWRRRPVSESGVFNRNTGTVIGITENKGEVTLVIEMVGEISGRILINNKKYVSNGSIKNAFPVYHNFATTVYGSQGQTVDKTFKKHGDFDFRLAYVGASRHRKEMAVYVDEQELITKIDRFGNKALPKELLEALYDRGVFDVNDRDYDAPRAKRYRHSAYLSMMAQSWGKLTEKETVYGFEKKVKMKKMESVSSAKKKREFDRERLIIADDPQLERTKKIINAQGEEEISYEDNIIEKTKIDDTCIYDYKVQKPGGETLIEIATNIAGYDNMSNSLFGLNTIDKIKREKILKIIDNLCFVNNIKNDNINRRIEFGYELYFDNYYSKPLPDRIDFEKLEMLTREEFRNTQDSKRSDTYEISKIEEKDVDNRTVLDEKEMERLVALDKEKQAVLRKVVNPLYLDFYDEILKNERKISNRSQNDSGFNFEDYKKTDRYSEDMSKAGGGLDRWQIEKELKENWVYPEKINIPLLPKEEFVAHLNNKGEIIFNDYDQQEKNASEQREYDSFKNFVSTMRDVYWGVTMHRQIRVFATNPYDSKVTSRYDINGNCIVGDGHPPQFLSPLPQESKFVLIVPSFESALKTHKLYTARFKDKMTAISEGGVLDSSDTLSTINIEKLRDEKLKEGNIGSFIEVARECPNIIWGAEGVDWGLYFKSIDKSKNLNNEVSKMLILVGTDPSEKVQKWATNLRAKIFNEYGHDIRIKWPKHLEQKYNNNIDLPQLIKKPYSPKI